MARKAKWQKWIVIRESNGKMCCLHCGATESLNTPAPIKSFLGQMQYFSVRHEDCPPPGAKP